MKIETEGKLVKILLDADEAAVLAGETRGLAAASGDSEQDIELQLRRASDWAEGKR